MDFNISKIKELTSLLKYIHSKRFQNSLKDFTEDSKEIIALKLFESVLQKHYIKTSEIQN